MVLRRVTSHFFVFKGAVQKDLQYREEYVSKLQTACFDFLSRITLKKLLVFFFFLL